MNVKALKCPQCGAALDIKEGLSSCYCMYCGTKLSVTDNKLEITINKNININSKTSHERTNRRVDEAAILEAKLRDEKDKRDNRVVFFLLLMLFAMGISILLVPKIIHKASEGNGQISVGYASSFEGEDYHAVVAHFEGAGFVNINLVDLDDSGLLFWKDGKVSQVSIAGNTSFDEFDYFSPESMVVISYH